MISLDEVQAGLAGGWRLMMGKPDGLRALDLSADGFWNSFFAMLVALPPLFVMWSGFAIEAAPNADFGIRLSLLLRMAAIDLLVWIVPLVLLALAARPAGIADRFVHYVVGSNWASAIVAWMVLPPVLLRRFFDGAREVADLLSLLIFIGTLVLMWRLTNATLGKGAGMATAVFACMVAVSLLTILALEWLLGIPSLQPV